MKLRNYSCLIFLALAAASSSAVAEITGKVRGASGDMATVVIEGDTMPAVGDSVEILFRLAGATEDVLVASGKVAAVEAKVVKVKIENASGAVEKGELVRFSSNSSPVIPNKSSSDLKRLLVGEWHRVYQPLLFTFRPDGTAQIVDHGEQIEAKYRVDYTQEPWQLDLFAFSNAPETQKDVVLKAICKIEGDTFYFSSNEPGQERPTEFLKHMSSGVRDSNGPRPSAESPLVGTWNLEQDKQTFTFTADGKLHTHWESSGVQPSNDDMRYEVDESATPMRLNVYYREVNGNPSWRGIVEFESDTRMRLEYTIGKDEERPKIFGPKAQTFTRAPSAR